MNLCKISECSAKVVAWGWCDKHYRRWKNHGDPEYVKPVEICTITDCGQQAKTRGWCQKHYMRWYKHGDPNHTENYHYKDFEESFKLNTLWVGDCLIWTGAVSGDNYGAVSAKGEFIYAHRYAWERVNGPIPEGMLVDHYVCYKHNCVNIEHLRLATHAENLQNRKGYASNNTTGHRNVTYKDGKYHVDISKNYVYYYFGCYTDIEEAAKVAEDKRKELFGEYAGKG